jgi:hypothetical protein
MVDWYLNNKLESIWKEMVMDNFEILYQQLSRAIKEK